MGEIYVDDVRRRTERGVSEWVWVRGGVGGWEWGVGVCKGGG